MLAVLIGTAKDEWAKDSRVHFEVQITKMDSPRLFHSVWPTIFSIKNVFGDLLLVSGHIK